MRTFGGIRKRHEQFLRSGGNLKDASKYANCINKCIIEEDNETRVISVVPPEELHLLMGGVNVHMDLLIEIYGLEFVETWTRSVNVLRHGYLGFDFDWSMRWSVGGMVGWPFNVFSQRFQYRFFASVHLQSCCSIFFCMLHRLSR